MPPINQIRNDCVMSTIRLIDKTIQIIRSGNEEQYYNQTSILGKRKIGENESNETARVLNQIFRDFVTKMLSKGHYFVWNNLFHGDLIAKFQQMTDYRHLKKIQEFVALQREFQGLIATCDGCIEMGNYKTLRDLLNKHLMRIFNQMKPIILSTKVI